jgi:branched-chain amino acid aminotransferase
MVTMRWTPAGWDAPQVQPFAAVITPIGSVLARSGDFTVGDGAPGPWATRLREELLGIQEGSRTDRFGWMRDV